MTVVESFIQSAERNGYYKDINWRSFLTPLLTLCTISEYVGLVLASFDVDQRFLASVGRRCINQDDERNILNEIQDNQPQINIISQKIQSKLANLNPIPTEMSKSPVHRFSEMYIKRYDLYEQFTAEIVNTGECRNSFRDAYISLTDTLNLLRSLEASRKAPLNQINTALATLSQNIKLLRNSQAYIKFHLESANYVLNEYIRNRAEWIQSLINYIKILESGQWPSLSREDIYYMTGEDMGNVDLVQATKSARPPKSARLPKDSTKPDSKRLSRGVDHATLLRGGY